MRLSRRSLLVLMASAAGTGITGPAFAASAPVFSTDGVAIRGYDAVAYFKEMAPVKGTPDFTAMWMGTTWQFSTADNRDAFVADPDSFAPQFGGYCAYAASKGAIATSVPEAWTVHQGKLYLNFSLNVRDIWRQDIPGNIARAENFWPGILG